MSRARQNLRKRMVQAGRRWTPISGGRPYGDEWRRLAERRGFEPLPEPSPEALARKLSLSSTYGKFGSRP